MSESSSCSLCPSAVGGVGVPGFDGSSRGVVASLWCFHLCFPEDVMQSTFSCAYLPCVYFPWWGVPLLNQVVYFLTVELWVLCLFWKQSFIRYVFCKYFLPVCGLSYHSLDIAFVEQKFLILMKFSLSILPFMDVSLVLYHCHTQEHVGFPPCCLLGVS